MAEENAASIKLKCTLDEEQRKLVDALVLQGEKCTPENIVGIAMDANTGKIVWLETGNSTAGLEHAWINHGEQFATQGISREELPGYIMEAVKKGSIVGYQGRKNPRTIYEFEYNGRMRRIAITISSNGFIVGANPRSMGG